MVLINAVGGICEGKVRANYQELSPHGLDNKVERIRGNGNRRHDNRHAKLPKEVVRTSSFTCERGKRRQYNSNSLSATAM